jgi:hypothetical protein
MNRPVSAALLNMWAIDEANGIDPRAITPSASPPAAAPPPSIFEIMAADTPDFRQEHAHVVERAKRPPRSTPVEPGKPEPPAAPAKRPQWRAGDLWGRSR